MNLKEISMQIRYFLCFLVLLNSVLIDGIYSQNKDKIYELTLESVIKLATDSSLNAFIAENTYYASYWEYKTYLAEKRPFLNFSTSPSNFSRYVTQEYIFLDSSYQYINQQTLNSTANLSINQNITATGGALYIDSELGRLENLNRGQSVQYSSVPIRIGLTQPILGFNEFKWQNKIEPVKFEKAKKQLVESIEEISLTAVEYFFNMARMQVNYEIASTNLANADTLYSIGQKRFKIASISQEDLYTLNLEKINAQNAYKESSTKLKRARLKLLSLLRVDNDIDFVLKVPHEIPSLDIATDACLQLAIENNPVILEYKQQQLEAEREVERIKKESGFNANLNASFGLNQRGNNISSSYQNPLDQEIVRLSLNVPIVDWGLAKGKYNLVQKNREVLDAGIEQAIIDFEQDVLMTVEEFNIQDDLVSGAALADTIGQYAYEIAKKRFITGKVDVTKLNATQKASVSAKTTYIDALENYWSYYYTIRKLTLYDFETKKYIIENYVQLLNLQE